MCMKNLFISFEDYSIRLFLFPYLCVKSILQQSFASNICYRYIFPVSGFSRLLYCCCSVIKLCLTLCDPMDCNTPGCHVLHYLLEFAQVHVHWVGDAIQPSYPLPPTCPPALNLYHHQSLFQWVSSLHQMTKVIGVSASASVLPMNIQGWFPLGLTGLVSLLSKGLSRVFTSTIIRKHQFFTCQYSLWSNSHIRTWLLEKP